MIKLKSILNEYLLGFKSTDNKSKFQQPENFDKYDNNKEWKAYRGGNDWESGITWVAVYIDQRNNEKIRIWFEIKYPNHLDKLARSGISSSNSNFKEIQEIGYKISEKWISEAKKIKFKSREKILPDSFRYTYKKWEECFLDALKSKEISPFVKNWGLDITKWKSMEKDNSEII